MNPPEGVPESLHQLQSRVTRHEDRVLGLADRLRAGGIDRYLDQYKTSPSEGWLRWMLSQVEDAASSV